MPMIHALRDFVALESAGGILLALAAAVIGYALLRAALPRTSSAR